MSGQRFRPIHSEFHPYQGPPKHQSPLHVGLPSYHKKRRSVGEVSPPNLRSVRYLERALQDAEEKIERISSNRESSDNDKNIEVLEKKNRQLSRALEDAESKLKNPLSTTSWCDKHDAKISELTKTNKILKNALNMTEKKVKELEEQAGDSGERIMEAYNNTNDSKESNSLLKELEKSKDRIKSLEYKVSKAENICNSPIVKIRLALEESDKKLKDLKKKSGEQCYDLRHKLETAQENINILTDQLKDKDEETTVIENKLSLANVNIKLNQEKTSIISQAHHLLEENQLAKKIKLMSQEFSDLSDVIEQVEDIFGKSQDKNIERNIG